MKRIYYRLHTEFQETLEIIVSAYFECFAIFKGRGYWHRVGEDAACIEIIGTEADRVTVLELAAAIQKLYAQEAVYVSVTPCELVDMRGAVYAQSA